MAMIQIDWNPPPKALRTFGLIGLVAFALLATAVYFQVGGQLKKIPDGAIRPTAYILGALAGYCGLFAALAPTLLKPLYVLLTVVTFPIGLVISYIVVTIMFYFVITPIGLIFKLIGKDPMTRQFDPAAPSYWIRREPPASVKRYFRQF